MHKYALSADSMVIGQVHCTVRNFDSFRTAMNKYIADNKMQMIASKIAYNEDGTATYDLTLRMNQDITVSDLSEFLESNEGVNDICCELGTK